MSKPPTPDPRPANRLAGETSPYLLQHAHNPVDWYPWSEEAFSRARAEDRPILLSVGYSACHWCHVMERESFEDPTIARQMNDSFINIKVDREERPDVDEIYMKAVQAFSSGRGGWPMTVFLTPDGRPFLGGTYFPPTPRHGIPSFSQLMAHALRIWTDHREEVESVGNQLVKHLQATTRLPGSSEHLEAGWLERLADAVDPDFDERHGGFGGRPKFPPHATLAALLAHWRRTGARRSLTMVTRTLDGMAAGGMYDILGGGFARYSVDESWRIPHFEKMLYDNAQLVPIYLDAYRATGKSFYRRIACETLDWVLAEMTHPEGGFCASLDADSEGEEGRFFVWTPLELRQHLGLIDGARAAVLLEVTDRGSFEHGTSVLRLQTCLEELSEEDQALIGRVQSVLKTVRDGRVAPDRDDKVITCWNAMMISAFARVGAALGEPRYLDAAENAVQFLLDTLVIDGRLQRTWKDGRAHLLAYADDHAALVLALLDLYECRFELRWLDLALHWGDVLVDLFWDDEADGLFYTGRDAERLVTRSKNMIGGAEPSSNGLAALAFARLDLLCGRSDLGERADLILRRYQAVAQRAPRAVALEALAASWRTGAVFELAVVGPTDDPRTQALIEVFRGDYRPFGVLACMPEAQISSGALQIPWMAHKTAPDQIPTAYLCERGQCLAPTTRAETLREQLADRTATSDGGGAERVAAHALPSDPQLWLNSAGPLSLESLRGKVVVLDFWTYCCINCQHMLAELAAVEAAFSDQPVVVVGVHTPKFPTERQRDSVERALARHGVRHPVVLDGDQEIWRAYEIEGWPSVVVLDHEGRIAWRRSGEVDRETLGAVIADLLAEGELAGGLQPHSGSWLSPPLSSPGLLAWPGKVAMYPAPAAQIRGAPIFSSRSRLYIADTGHHRIIEASLSRGLSGWPVAQVRRVFGTGEPGLEDGPLDQARFRGPQGMSRAGNVLWVADTENHAIRAIDLEAGVVRTVCGTGQLAHGNPGDLSDPRRVALRSPWDVVAPDGAPGEQQVVFIAMAGQHQIWVYLPKQDRLAPLVGSGQEGHVDGMALEAALAQPSGLALAGRHLFIADSEVSSIRVFDLSSRRVSTLAGQGLFDFGDVDGEGEEVRLQHPLGLTMGRQGLFVADTFNHKIKTLSMPGTAVRTLYGGTTDRLCEPGGIERCGDFLLVADTNNHRLRVVRPADGACRDLTVLT